MTDRWDAEAREALCCCDGSRERSHALYCPADNSALVACVVALARRAYREGLERAIRALCPTCRPDHVLDNGRVWVFCGAGRLSPGIPEEEVAAAIRHEIEGA